MQLQNTPSYSFEVDDQPGVVIIHEETCTYRMSQQSLEGALSDLKANKKAYCDTGLYDDMRTLFTDALHFLKKVGIKS